MVLCLSEVKSSFLNKFILVKNNYFCWFIKSSVCTSNVSMKLLLKSSKSFFMLLVFWVQTLGIKLCLGMDRHMRLETILHFIELLACNNAKDFSKLYIAMASYKESLTCAKTSYLQHFLFWCLSVSIEAIMRSSAASLSSILTWDFVVSFTTLECVFGGVSLFYNVNINCVVFS